jgi:hypothetical protein
LVMTTKLDIERKKIEAVWNSFKDNTAPMFSATPGHEEEFLKAELVGSEFIEFLKRPNNFDPTTLKGMIQFIELCQEEKKLMNWTIALKLKGRSQRKLGTDFSMLPCETGLAVRNAPTSEHGLNQLRTDKVFRVSGKSANIISSNLDLALTLTGDEIKIAEKEFLQERRKSLKNKKLSDEEIEGLLPKTIPERVYRERIPDSHGILIIYLFDTHHSLVPKKDPEGQFQTFVREEGYDLDIPLVGYAIGFPPIDGAPGGQYAVGDYDLNDEGAEEDVSDDDMALPGDEVVSNL